MTARARSALIVVMSGAFGSAWACRRGEPLAGADADRRRAHHAGDAMSGCARRWTIDARRLGSTDAVEESWLLTLDVIDSRAHAAYYEFTVMHELRDYLEMLLNHQCTSGNGDCRDCKNLQRIYQFMQTDIFSTVIYTETSLEPRQPSRSQSQPVN